jgi:hypothetical protein
MNLGKTLKTLLVVTFCGLSSVVYAGTITDTLGASAGFTNGQKPIGVSTWNTAVAGNSAPFNAYIGSNVSGPNFTASWTFSYGSIVDPILNATLTLGILDLDSAAPGNQIASFGEGSNNLTALANTVAEGLHGGAGSASREYDILTFTLPSTTFASLSSGGETFTLTLQGPGLGALGSTPFDGAGIDFSTITINTQTQGAVPEPATWSLFLVGIGGIVGGRLFRRA